LKSFLFTLKNPHNIPARRFALKAEEKHHAVLSALGSGPSFGLFHLWDDCNGTYLGIGTAYTNDTGVDGKEVFTGSQSCQIKEIEVFEFTN
jgi:hypothetical protein